MTNTMPLPTPAHRAALTLHALSGPDRQWVLAALSDGQRETLNRLLQELEQLGIPRDAELAAALAAESTGEESGARALRALDKAGVHRLAEILSAEPPRLVVALLAGAPWPWRERLLALLSPTFRREVQRHAGGAPPPPLLHDTIVAQLVPVLHAHAARAARSSRWQALRRRLAALGGQR
ncbi:MAG TPA: hypothetical protein VFM98_24330 [Ramlibacter sp.]|uniref:hypothetical protein n=1 Tax=Ramlibacter sp. TaxID=1917967 RepID=UPI002D7FD944|nr:hypothetical protein [Ramlibacter sp.]HET8748745.1 hypothetical protein [Ramlibacter sp.]